MEPYYKNDRVTLYHGDCREIIPLMGEKIDLLLTDPPYSRVVDETWDRLSQSELTALLDEMLLALSPRMAPNAAIYIFAWPKFAGILENIVARHFHVLNHIVWNKQGKLGRKNGRVAKAKISNLRNFYPETERIIFAESNGCDEDFRENNERLRGRVFAPLIEYFRKAKTESGLCSAEIREKMFQLTGKRYVLDGHAFSYSQWGFPTKDQFIAAASFLPLGEYGCALKNYHEALKRYRKLSAQYHQLRRCHQAGKNNYTDLWNYLPILPGQERHHPCQKPRQMLVDMITTSSRPGAMILDCFAGSGQTALAALDTGRRCILIEQDEKYCEIAANRIEKEAEQPELFGANKQPTLEGMPCD